MRRHTLGSAVSTVQALALQALAARTALAALAAVTAFALLAAPSAPAAPPDDVAGLSADDLLARMVQRYAAARSYEDRGSVTTVFTRDDGRSFTTGRRFRTAFVRPDEFRFEFVDELDMAVTKRFIVWKHGLAVRRFWDPHGDVEYPSSLSLALAGATGVSSGSAHVVPRLLLPDEVGGRSLADMTRLERLEDADCDGAPCARIAGFYAGERRTIWIELGTLLLRRIEHERDSGRYRTLLTTIYEDAAADEPVDPVLLEFGAP